MGLAPDSQQPVFFSTLDITCEALALFPSLEISAQHSLGVVVFCSNPDQHILAWELRRYVQAIVRTCLNGRILGSGSSNGAWGTGFQRIAWGPTLESASKPQTWMSFALFTLWARREEL